MSSKPTKPEKDEKADPTPPPQDTHTPTPRDLQTPPPHLHPDLPGAPTPTPPPPGAMPDTPPTWSEPAPPSSDVSSAPVSPSLGPGVADHPHAIDPRSGEGTANPINLGAVDPGASGAVSLEGRAVDVDPLVPDAAREGFNPAWRSPKAMIEAIERHAKTSHGLSSDVDLLKRIAAHLRVVLGVPTKEQEDAEREADKAQDEADRRRERVRELEAARTAPIPGSAVDPRDHRLGDDLKKPSDGGTSPSPSSEAYKPNTNAPATPVSER